MYLDEDELRPCRACGRACDGDVCDEACRQWMEDRDTPDPGEFQDTSEGDDTPLPSEHTSA